jgi:hypothetical protein
MEVSLEANAGKTEDIFMSRYQNGGRKHCLVIANEYLESTAMVRYLRTITNQNCIHGD